MLPAGARVLVDATDSRAQVSAHGATSAAVADDLALDDPLAAGMYVDLVGRAPRAADEVVLDA